MNTTKAPYEKSHDLREAVRMATLFHDINTAFQGSPEIGMLQAAYGPECKLTMEVSSSLKYTRFAFPFCPHLVKEVTRILESYNCQLIGRPEGFARAREAELTVPRLGKIYKRWIFGEES